MSRIFLVSPSAVVEYTGKNHHMAIKASLKKTGMFYAVSVSEQFSEKRPFAGNVLTKTMMQVAQCEAKLIAEKL